MDRFQTHFTARTCLGFLLLILLQTSTEAQLCTFPPFVEFPENNMIDAVVTDFTIGPDVTAVLGSSGDSHLFRIDENKLIANEKLDRESKEILGVEIICTVPAGNREDHTLSIVLTDVNDNPPIFGQDLYEIPVDELTPVDTSVYRIAATDADNPSELYYTLKSEYSFFKLQSPTNPNLLVAEPLQYHKVKNPIQLTLEVQDTPVGSGEPTFNDSTTINVNITDKDNRQPWFQPCEELDVDGVVTCYNRGYTGTVILNKEEPGPLELTPGPLYAIDGDSGINEAITYSIVSGNERGLFAINGDTGEITMTKAADVLEDIVLTVRASQKTNIYQVAVTTVTISVKEGTPHPPVFEKPLYEGVVAGAGTMVLNLDNRTETLQIIAKDEDYSGDGGVNPHITYKTDRSNDFVIFQGYVFMLRDLPEGTVTMQVTATDSTNGESATTELVVKVESSLTTTTVEAPLGTTSNTATTTKGGSVPDGTTTSHILPSPGTSPPKTTTTNPSGPTGGSVAPTKPSQTSQGGVTTTSTAQPYTGLTTTTVEAPLGTTSNTATTTKGGSVPDGTTTSHILPSPGTSPPKTTTTNPSGPTGGSVAPTKPSQTSQGGVTTTSTAQPYTGQGPATGGGSGSTASTASPTTAKPPGGYELSDMLALGLTLGILLLICLVIIILLICHIKRRKQDWEKIYETTVFRSSLGIGPQKDGIQYINKAFQNDYDEVKLGSHGPEERSKITDGGFPVYETVQKSSVLLPDILPDNTSQTSSDKSDDEKEVKPILTKERRSEEGYKAVWFKEDIDPDAKVEVVIIPDSRGNDSEVEDDDAQSSSREVDTDLDSEIESKTGDQTDDSEDDRELSADL